MLNNDICVSCGEYVPEGTCVCMKCSKSIDNKRKNETNYFIDLIKIIKGVNRHNE